MVGIYKIIAGLTGEMFRGRLTVKELLLFIRLIRKIKVKSIFRSFNENSPLRFVIKQDGAIELWDLQAFVKVNGKDVDDELLQSILGLCPSDFESYHNRQ